MTSLTDEQKNAVDHAQKILRGVKLYSHAEMLAAAPAQSAEPVAWMLKWPGGITEVFVDQRTAVDAGAIYRTKPIPLYAAPPSQHAEGGETAPTVKIYETYTGQNGWLEVTQEEYDRTKDKYEHRIRRVPAPSAVVLDDERAAFEQAFQLIFEAYSAPRDRWPTDDGYILSLRRKVTAAFGLLQKVRAASPQPVAQTRALTVTDEMVEAAYGRFLSPSSDITRRAALARVLEIAAQPASGATET